MSAIREFEEIDGIRVASYSDRGGNASNQNNISS